MSKKEREIYSWLIFIAVLVFLAWPFVVHGQTFTKPDNVPSVTVYWSHDNQSGEPITFRLYANGTVIWSGGQKETTLARSVFAVDNLLYVTALDSVPNESEPSPTIALTFTPVEEPPDIPAEYDTFPLTFSRTNLEGWTRYGNVIVVTGTDGGVQLFGKYSSNTNNVAMISGSVVSEKAQDVKVIVSAKTRYNDPLETMHFSVQNPEKSVQLNSRSAWTDYSVGIFHLEQGLNILQVRSYNTEFLVRSVSLVPVDADVTAPLAPGGLGVR
jgi:hypothetical protein